MCSVTIMLLCLHTCSELNIVNSHANTVVLLLTVRMPKTHVRPSRGRRTIVAINKALNCTEKEGLIK